jgi:quercetin dioxygenase-like cupin family protein
VEHRKNASIEWTPAPSENFTGDVWFGTLSQDGGPEGLNALGVQFVPGARTDWHSHPGGQVLYVTSGAGLVANEDGDRVEVAAGDVVYAPAGELHWHGATPNSPMMHLSLTTGGATEWEPRKVSDAEYRG